MNESKTPISILFNGEPPTAADVPTTQPQSEVIIQDISSILVSIFKRRQVGLREPGVDCSRERENLRFRGVRSR